MEKVREGISWYVIEFIAVVHRSVNSGKKQCFLLCSDEMKSVWDTVKPQAKNALKMTISLLKNELEETSINFSQSLCM